MLVPVTNRCESSVDGSAGAIHVVKQVKEHQTRRAPSRLFMGQFTISVGPVTSDKIAQKIYMKMYPLVENLIGIQIFR